MPSTCTLQIRRAGSHNAPWKTLRSYPLVSDALRAALSPTLKGQSIQIQIVPNPAKA